MTAIAATRAHAPVTAPDNLSAAPVVPPPVALAEGVAVGVAAAVNSPNVANDASGLTLPMLEQNHSLWAAAAVAAAANVISAGDI